MRKPYYKHLIPWLIQYEANNSKDKDNTINVPIKNEDKRRKKKKKRRKNKKRIQQNIDKI